MRKLRTRILLLIFDILIGASIKEILVHVCVALSIACISFKILDWYNPYIDFEGHTAVLHYLLYFGALGLGISRIFRQRGRQRHAEQ